ncbi:hypothetical protein [Flavobacterium laiguense]|uniref:Outer membrane protein beta-barrel domain-containing protein n=1 Tax=Flavobacterium laiguense TaxID=2169409 RepID=A0A2U1JVB6_9FLAO|nr:hypothetical protein [Flavobacterium laiguense]PWA08915.1 hypothetical protein DB891_09675 [Flavobacterium laiguense]
MKKIILFILLIISMNANAQTVRGFGGFSSYLQWDFYKSSYFGVNTGTEFKISSYFMPELEFSYFYGTLEQASRYNNQLLQTSSYTRSVSSLNFSFCPKIALGNKKDGAGYLVILPRYTFSQIEAKGDFIVVNESKTLIENRDFQKGSQHSLGLGIGYDIDTSDDNSNSLCLILYYSGVNLGKVINEMEHSSGYKINDKGVLGAGLNYYFSFKKEPRPKPRPIKIPEPLQ